MLIELLHFKPHLSLPFLAAAAPGIASSLIGGLGAIFGGKAKRKAQAAADQSIENIQTYADSPYGKANMQLAEADINANMPGSEEAKMNLGQSATQMLSAAKTRKGGLGSIGSIQAQQTKGLQNLATQNAQFKQGAKQRLVGERGKAFSSAQEKQQLKAQQALARAGAAAAQQSQFMGMLGKGIGQIGQAAVDNPFGKKNKTKQNYVSTSDVGPDDDYPE